MKYEEDNYGYISNIKSKYSKYLGVTKAYYGERDRWLISFNRDNSRVRIYFDSDVPEVDVAQIAKFVYDNIGKIHHDTEILKKVKSGNKYRFKINGNSKANLIKDRIYFSDFETKSMTRFIKANLHNRLSKNFLLTLRKVIDDILEENY